MRRSLFLAVFAAHLTAACQTTPTPQIEIQTREIPIPIPVTCVPNTLPEAKPFTVTQQTLLSAPDPAERYRQAVVGMLERDARLIILEPVITGCRAAPTTGTN